MRSHKKIFNAGYFNLSEANVPFLEPLTTLKIKRLFVFQEALKKNGLKSVNYIRLYTAQWSQKGSYYSELMSTYAFCRT